MQSLQSQVVVTHFTANSESFSIQLKRVIKMVYAQSVEVVSLQIGFDLGDIAVAKLPETISWLSFILIH